MKLKITVLAASLGIFLMTGCIETKNEVTINPDGSGKTLLTIKQPLDPMMGFNMGNDKEDKETPDEKAKKEIASILKGSEGVDTWENVTYKIDDNNNLIFKGTAYFKSFMICRSEAL